MRKPRRKAVSRISFHILPNPQFREASQRRASGGSPVREKLVHGRAWLLVGDDAAEKGTRMVPRLM